MRTWFLLACLACSTPPAARSFELGLGTPAGWFVQPKDGDVIAFDGTTVPLEIRARGLDPVEQATWRVNDARGNKKVVLFDGYDGWWQRAWISVELPAEPDALDVEVTLTDPAGEPAASGFRVRLARP